MKNCRQISFDAATLRRLAGRQSFRRGEEYFAEGRVASLVESGGVLHAKVRGSRRYQVALRVDRDDIDYSCSCPIGEEGEFCKHCVAAGLHWLDAGKPAQPARRPRTITLEDVRTHLSGWKTQALVDLIISQATRDDELRRRLLLKAAPSSGRDLDLQTYRDAIDEAVATDEFVDYRSAYEYAQQIDRAVDSLDELLKAGHVADVIELAEHALRAVEDALGSVDDSDGATGSVLERLQDLHYEACRRAKPDPKELATRLFEWEMRTDWDTFSGAVERYAKILGTSGLAEYRALAEQRWASVPDLQQGQERHAFDQKRFRVTQIMESLARQTQDLEALVAVKKRDLSSAYSYLQIAEAYREARQHDNALEWAQRGIKAFPKRTDSRLREFLADEYHRRGRHEEAIALAWVDYCDSPCLDRYQNLRTHAERGGAWTQRREQALKFARDAVTAENKSRNRRSLWFGPSDHSLLVRIFLWEKDVDAAWREAQTSGCSDALWMELAAKREQEHPADVLPIYEREVERLLERKNNNAYTQAVGLLRRSRALVLRLENAGGFAEYVRKLRAVHKPKRNFIRLLDQAKW